MHSPTPPPKKKLQKIKQNNKQNQKKHSSNHYPHVIVWNDECCPFCKILLSHTCGK